MTQSDYQRVLDECGEWEALTSAQRTRHLRAWRHLFAAGLHDQMGKWKHREFDWHVFSFEFARALNGDEAMAAYAAVPAGEVLVIPESKRLEAVRLRSKTLPKFRAFRGDVIVCPRSLEWTVVFTHEESLGLGPYFSRREWM